MLWVQSFFIMPSSRGEIFRVGVVLFTGFRVSVFHAGTDLMSGHVLFEGVKE